MNWKRWWSIKLKQQLLAQSYSYWKQDKQSHHYAKARYPQSKIKGEIESHSSHNNFKQHSPITRSNN